MGRAKEKGIGDFESGFTSGSDLKICSNHFDDDDIVKFIEDNSHSGICCFCDLENETDEEMKVIDWDSLMRKIITSINYFYTDPADGLYYDSAEGGYQTLSEPVYDSREIISDFLEAEEEVIEEVVNSMSDQSWTRKEFYGPSESDILEDMWTTFCSLVKFKVRYLFTDIEERGESESFAYRPYSILKSLGDYIIGLQLIKEFPERRGLFEEPLLIYRARQHKIKSEVKLAKDIGPPTSKYAQSNRFSPEGIPMFYGAENRETAIAEIINFESKDKYISVGQFKHNRVLNLVDLRSIPAIGFFNTERLEYIEPALFLREFLKSITKKNSPDSKDRIEYIPSQIVTEYIRFSLPQQAGKRIDGIIYKSTRCPDKDCYALFFDCTFCQDECDSDASSILILKSKSILTEKVADIINRNKIRN